MRADLPPALVLLFPSLVGLALASLGLWITSVSGGYWVLGALAGIGINALGLSRLGAMAESMPADDRSYVHFLAIVFDVASICLLIAVLGGLGILQSPSACAAALMYLVFLLCSLIKTNAMKKLVHPKVMRIGRVVRAGICLMILSSLAPHLAVVTGHVQLIDLTDLLALTAAGAAMAACVVRAARVRSALALSEPPPMPAAAFPLAS